jgi:hypothetical protein
MSSVWPPVVPRTVSELQLQEAHFDVFDVYLWLGMRFPVGKHASTCMLTHDHLQDMFQDILTVREMQQDLDDIIRSGVTNLTKLQPDTGFEQSARIGTSDGDVEPRQGVYISRRGGGMNECADETSTESLKLRKINERLKILRAKRREKDLQFSRTYDVTEDNVKTTTVVPPKERLSDKLVRNGLLSARMLEQLRKEMQADKSTFKPKKNK